MITPKDIELKEFKVAKLGGFDKEDVNEFLDEIIIEMDRLIKENEKLKEDLTVIKAQSDIKTNTESSLYDTLEKAKGLMNDIAASAERRAEVLLKNAELDAELIKREAKEAVRIYSIEGDRLKKRVENFRSRYVELLNEELKYAEDTSSDLLLEFENDFLSDDSKKDEEVSKKDELKETIVVKRDETPDNEELKKTIVVEKIDLENEEI